MDVSEEKGKEATTATREEEMKLTFLDSSCCRSLPSGSCRLDVLGSVPGSSGHGSRGVSVVVFFEGMGVGTQRRK